jgi:uncharacterized protein
VTALYEGHVAHRRSTGHRTAFRHPAYVWLVDVDELPRLPRLLRPFARLRADDHLSGPQVTLRGRLDDLLAREGLSLDGGQALLLTNARVLGYVFNPLSVWWCHGPDGALRCVVAEVHNTHGQRHAYVLRPDADGTSEADKVFEVSPFLALEGRYRIRLPEPGERVALAIELEQGGERVFAASLTGRRRPATPRVLAGLLLRHPWMTLKVATLIRLHGIALFLRRQRVPQEAR